MKLVDAITSGTCCQLKFGPDLSIDAVNETACTGPAVELPIDLAFRVSVTSEAWQESSVTSAMFPTIAVRQMLQVASL